MYPERSRTNTGEHSNSTHAAHTHGSVDVTFSNGLSLLGTLKTESSRIKYVLMEKRH